LASISEKGSGNMGSTNAFRILGWKWGLTVQILDILKGFLAVVVVANILGQGVTFGGYNTYFEDITIVKLIAGISAVCGHIWTVFAGFKGGKGINTAAGMLIGIAPVDVGIAIGIFILALIFSGYVSLGSISGALAFPSSLLVRYNLCGAEIPGYHILLYFAIILAVLLIFTHRQNIIRLIKGTENKFSKLQVIKCNKNT
jgi:acyl phosphate:glycerol-3-phosphate acyltransferase